MQKYLRSPANKTKNLVRFYYHDKEDVFDAVTYEKGGRILNMLRNYLGDAATSLAFTDLAASSPGSITLFGVAPEHITLSATTNSSAGSNEVQIFVR